MKSSVEQKILAQVNFRQGYNSAIELQQHDLVRLLIEISSASIC